MAPSFVKAVAKITDDDDGIVRERRRDVVEVGLGASGECDVRARGVERLRGGSPPSTESSSQ